MSKSAQPSEQKQEQQVIAEDFTESTAESISHIVSSKPNTTSPLPTIRPLRTMSTCRESTFCLSTARIQLTSNLAPIFASQYTPLLLALASRFIYINYAKEMKSTGQGQMYGMYRRCILDVSVQGFSHEDMAFFSFCGHVVTVRQGFLRGYRPIRPSATWLRIYSPCRHIE